MRSKHALGVVAIILSILLGILFAIQATESAYRLTGIALAVATILLASWQFFADTNRGNWAVVLLCCVQLGLVGMDLFSSSYSDAGSRRNMEPGSVADVPQTAQWNISVKDDNEATLISPAQSDAQGVVRVEIKKANTQTGWHIQLNLAPLKVQSRQRYSVSFRARAGNPRNVFLGVARNHNPWTDVGLYRALLLTPEWSSFQEEFMASADDDNVRILFDIGGSKISPEFADLKLIRL